MNAFALICILLAAGVTGFLFYAGQALVAVARRPKEPRHVHKWITQQEIEVFSSFSRNIPVARQYVLRCTECGELTKREVK